MSNEHLAPARLQRHFTNTQWPVPAAGDPQVLQAALNAANLDPDRGDRVVWYRVESTPTGPVIVIGYTTETTA